MAYRKGQRVRITHGMLKGRDATVDAHERRQGRIIYKLVDVEGYPVSYHIRGGYLRKVFRKRR